MNIETPWHHFPQQFRDREGPVVRADMMEESEGKIQSSIDLYFQLFHDNN